MSEKAREKTTILVVDDRPESLSTLVRVLSSTGYAVHSARSGSEGLAAALVLGPDLILLDVRLGDMDGLEVCRRLKSQSETRDVPIILVSAFAGAEEWIGGLELGAADYVTKPFRIAELLARVRTQLALGQTLSLLKERNVVIEQANSQLQAESAARREAEDKLRRSLERADRSRLALLSALEDEKRAEGDLQRANGFLDSIIENIPDMIVIKDARDLRVVRINRATESVFGVPRADLLGKTDHELFPKPQADFFLTVDRKVLETRESIEIPDEPILTAKGVRILHTKKVPILGPDGAPTHLLSISVDVTERQRAQDAILSLSLRLEDILATVPEILVEVDSDMVYRWANVAGIKFFGEEVVGTAAVEYFVGDRASVRDLVRRLLEGEEDALYLESLQRRRDGAHRLLAWCCRPLRDARGKVKGALSSAHDITESRKAEEDRRRLEAQIRASQKMEAIGSLAGGVAHDFNNLLCVLQSYTEFAIRGVRHDDPVIDDLLAIKRAGERAATLTRQLLAFGRKQVLQSVPLSLNDVAAGMEKMLRRILGEDIEFVQVLAPDLGIVRADPGQIEQVLMNLAVNARDAMPNGGKLVVQTRNVEIDEDFLETQGPLPSGPYVEIAVTDTGGGMDEHTMARIFDPFFTTKERGKGTGLGLSTVYGIVKQSRGGLWVRSEVGKGATFKIYLPRELEVVAATIKAPAAEGRTAGTESVLLVEDEEDLRRVARRSLEGAGYTVISAGDGEEALKVASEHTGEIHLLLTDVVMPRLGGRALAQRLRQARPDIVVLYMSGYTDDAIIQHDLLDADLQLLGKPFTATALTQKVREVLDRANGAVPERRDACLPGQPPPASGSSVETLPPELADRLRGALVAARYDDLLAVVEQMQGTAPTLAGMIRQRLESFDYAAIAELLDGRREMGGVHDQ